MQSDDPPAVGTATSSSPTPPIVSSVLPRARSPNPDTVNRNDSNAYISTMTAPLSALSTSSSALMSAGLDTGGSPVSPTAPPVVTSSSLLNKLYQTQSVAAAARPRSQTMVTDRSRTSGRPPMVPIPPPPPSSSPSPDAGTGAAFGGGRAKSKSSSQLPISQPDMNGPGGILSPLSPAMAAPQTATDPREVQRHHTESTRRSKEGLSVDTSSHRSLNGEVKKSTSGGKLPVKKSSSLVNVVNAQESAPASGRVKVHEGVTRTWYLYVVVPLILGLWTGLAVILTGTVSIVTNLGNLIYSIHTTPTLWIPASLSILFYLYLILTFALSLTRTAFRLMTWFWTLPSRFGQPPSHAPTAFPHWSLFITSPHKAIPQAVDVAVERMTGFIWARVHPGPRAGGSRTRGTKRSLEESGKAESATSMYSSAGEDENAEEEEEDDDQQALIDTQESETVVRSKKRKAQESSGMWCQRSQLRIIIQLVLLLAVAYYKVGIPILFAVSHMGLASTCAMLSACVPLGAGALIVVVNVGKRTLRFAAVARQLWSEPDEGKRLGMAGASLGMSQGGVGDALNRVAEWAWATVAAVVVVGLTFYRYPESPIHLFVLCSLLVLLASFRLRSFVCRGKPSSVKSPSSPSLATKVSDSSLRTMFFLRSASVVAALTCSVTHDLLAPEITVRLGHIQLEKLTQFQDRQFNPANVVVCAFLFAVGLIGQDSVFAFINVFTARLSALLLTAFMVMRVIVFVTALTTLDATCLTFLTMGGLLIASWNIGNQGRFRGSWGRKVTRPQGSLQRRVLFNAGIVATIVGVWLVSVLGLSHLSIAGQHHFPTSDPRWPVLPREMTLAKDLLCNFKVHDLKLLELVSLATAPMAGDGSTGAMMEWVNQNPALRGSVRAEGMIQLGSNDQQGEAVAANPLGMQPAGNAKDAQQHSHDPFVEFRLATAPQTSILAVRGAHSFTHAILHARILWSTSWFFSASSPFGTLFKWWPDEVATLVVSTVHKVLSIAYMPETGGIEVVARMMQDQGRQVVIVGHGYAGALAHVVAARLGVPSFAASAPGLQYYRHLFGIMAPAGLSRWTSTLVPERDGVPALDKQVGTTLTLAGGCYGDEARCHDPKAMIMYLLDRCYWEEYYRNDLGGGVMGRLGVQRPGQDSQEQAGEIQPQQPLEQRNDSLTVTAQ